MTDLAGRKALAQQTIHAVTEDLRALSLDIHAHPELNFEEVHAHEVLTDFLRREGFTVERGAYGMATAFQATAGSGSPTVAVVCEYDALPGIGHACGHNLIAIAGVAAALGVRAALQPGEGTVRVLGAPAEEGGGGKVFLIERGAFTSVDCAMMLHPAPLDRLGPSRAMQQLDVAYHGRGAHASASPFDGLNALDALVLAYTNISALRQQLRPGQQVHGVFTEAGVKANIIPHHTRAEYMVRASDDADLEDAKQRVLACFEAAATASGCRLEYRWEGPPYSNMANNETLAEAFVTNATVLGWHLPSRQELGTGEGASTDMGNVSHVVPSIHPVFGIPAESANHTAGFTAAAATFDAHERTLRAASVLAMTALDVYLQPGVLEQAQESFRAAHPDLQPAGQR